ncbi:hypothetical protein C8039_11515 [Halogeometricum sp. wsp3]|nr:hypothetical protein C8039_11515 [Halogeometricum sp. wsp3]
MVTLFLSLAAVSVRRYVRQRRLSDCVGSQLSCAHHVSFGPVSARDAQYGITPDAQTADVTRMAVDWSKSGVKNSGQHASPHRYP